MKAHKIQGSFYFHKIMLIKLELLVRCNFTRLKFKALKIEFSVNLASLVKKILFLYNFMTYSYVGIH
jgi:hypothetical protein